MLDLIILKLLFIAVIGGASVTLNRFADKEVRCSGPWYVGNTLSILCGILTVSELAHLINFVRGGVAL